MGHWQSTKPGLWLWEINVEHRSHAALDRNGTWASRRKAQVWSLKIGQRDWALVTWDSVLQLARTWHNSVIRVWHDMSLVMAAFYPCTHTLTDRHRHRHTFLIRDCWKWTKKLLDRGACFLRRKIKSSVERQRSGPPTKVPVGQETGAAGKPSLDKAIHHTSYCAGVCKWCMVVWETSSFRSNGCFDWVQLGEPNQALWRRAVTGWFRSEQSVASSQ